MTPLELQNELVKELKRLLSGYSYRTPAGDYTSMNIYPQNLPVNETDDDADPAPYIIVRLHSGEDKGTRESFNIVKVVIIICTWDDSLDAQGYRDCMNIIHKLYERFQTNPNLNNKAVFKGEFDWAIQEDNYYPYSFGACSLDFYIAAIRREDPLV